MSFSVLIPQGSFMFDGPTDNLESLQVSAGVYVVMRKLANGRMGIIDVGSSSNVRERLKTHDRIACWQNYSPVTGIFFGAWYCDQQDMKMVEGWLRGYYQPPCGKI